FIGSVSLTNATLKTSWDAANLYVLVDVKDQHLWSDSPSPAWDDDGAELFIDPQNKNCTDPCSGVYKLLFNIGNKTLLEKGSATSWSAWNPTGVNYKIKVNGTLNNDSDTDQGYVIEIAVPWNQIGGQPAINTAWGIHFKLHDDVNGGGAEVHEDLSGDDPNKPSTWFRVDLKPAIITGTINAENIEGISIYPNPSNDGRFMVNYPEGASGKEYVIRITDVFGKEMLQIKSKLEKTQLVNAYGLQRGIYFMNIKNEEREITKKIIIY
ncbi:MAG: T9SS type A sorting domain-containing protein, partial [Bacteroidetes bacterium]|nr:T9SS type A sorting domain-containing protein [Bacteroidota bacterium]